jgi:hypothetical protein
MGILTENAPVAASRQPRACVEMFDSSEPQADATTPFPLLCSQLLEFSTSNAQIASFLGSFPERLLIKGQNLVVCLVRVTITIQETISLIGSDELPEERGNALRHHESEFQEQRPRDKKKHVFIVIEYSISPT